MTELMTSRQESRLPRWAWLWLPIGIAVVIAAARILDPSHAGDFPTEPGDPGFIYVVGFESEIGLIENGTVVLFLIGTLFGLAAWRRRAQLPNPLLGWWILGLSALGFLAAGEECSWGQVYFTWSTPDWLAKVNNQQETNLHNISGWFDQKPRALFSLWVLAAGLVWPVIAWRRGGHPVPSDWRAWFWPVGWILMPSTLLAIATRLPGDIDKLSGGAITHLLTVRYSEVQEVYFALFLVLYLASIQRRLAAQSPTTQDRP